MSPLHVLTFSYCHLLQHQDEGLRGFVAELTLQPFRQQESVRAGAAGAANLVLEIVPAAGASDFALAASVRQSICGEMIFLCSQLLTLHGIAGPCFGAGLRLMQFVLGLVWAIFHLLVITLQALYSWC